MNAAGDYLAARRELASRYVIPWLNALHGRDANSYASMLYELCLEFVGQSFLISEEEAGEVWVLNNVVSSLGLTFD